jgi:hypothetical protein
MARHGKGGHGKAWAIGLGSLFVVMMIWGAATGWKFFSVGTPPATTTAFSTSWVDLKNPTVEIDPVDGDLTVWGLTPGLDPTATSSWEVVAGFTDCADLTKARVDTALEDYSRLYAGFNFTVVNDANSYNDDFGDRVYAYREQAISTGANVFNINVAPNLNASAAFIYAANGSVVASGAAAANVTAIDGANVTMTLYLNNMSLDAYDQCFVPYTDHTGHWIGPNVVLGFQLSANGAVATVDVPDFTFVGLENDLVTTASLRFDVPSLGVTPQSYFGYFGADIITEATDFFANNATGCNVYLGTALV